MLTFEDFAKDLTADRDFMPPSCDNELIREPEVFRRTTMTSPGTASEANDTAAMSNEIMSDERNFLMQ